MMCGTLNGRKGESEDVLDPFDSIEGWFVLDFPSLLVKPAPALKPSNAAKVRKTINRLRLNDEGTCLKARARFVRDYCKGKVSFFYLESDAPFIAKELTRQNLIAEIKNIMGY
jgi:hypothetical protein